MAEEFAAVRGEEGDAGAELLLGVEEVELVEGARQVAGGVGEDAKEAELVFVAVGGGEVAQVGVEGAG